MHRVTSGLFLTGIASLSSSFSGTRAPVSTPGIQYLARAYGSSANVAGTVLAGRSALITFGNCGTTEAPSARANTVASVSVQPVVATGVVRTNVSASDVAQSETQTSRASAVVYSARLLSGLIVAGEVRAMSTTRLDATGFRTSAAGSRLGSVAVAGIPILVAPQPNTRIELVGIGHVVLNEQIRRIDADSASLSVNMIHVFVTIENPLIPVGADIIVGHATSELQDVNIAGTLGGFAHGTYANVRGVALSGRSAPVTLGCLGTNGALETESVASVLLPPGLTTGIVVDTATGVVSPASSTGETSSTVHALDLLSSLVTADVVRANAHCFTDGQMFTFTDAGSSFVNLSVLGFPAIGDDVPLNTRLTIAGLGTLWLRRVIYGSNSIEIRMIELVVNQANAFQLPIGARVQVAVAHAAAQ